MKHSEFEEKAQTHLSQYNKSGVKGIYIYTHQKTKKQVEHMHILPIEAETKEAKWESIKKYGILEEVKPYAENEKKEYINSLHSCAHHLTSSQIMCYNFFRPLMEKPEKLALLFQRICGSKKPFYTLTAQFEYEPNKNEKTNYDFYLGNSDIKIFCEIKYTEADFGKKCGAKPNSWDKRATELYPNLISQTPKLWKDDVQQDKQELATRCMKHHYQLFRNALSAKGENDFVFFICPQEREDLRMSYMDFMKKFMSEYGKQHVQFLTWENLVEKAQEILPELNIFFNNFKERYLAIK